MKFQTALLAATCFALAACGGGFKRSGETASMDTSSSGDQGAGGSPNDAVEGLEGAVSGPSANAGLPGETDGDPCADGCPNEGAEASLDCLADRDCPPGEVCAEGACGPGVAPSPSECFPSCRKGYVCVSGECVPREPDGCPGEACGFGGPCELASDCPPGMWCVNGECFMQCKGDRDCAWGERCDAAGRCVAKAGAACDPPCAADGYCHEGECLYGCNPYCADFEGCRYGSCYDAVHGDPPAETVTCAFDSDCPPFSHCGPENTCTAECFTNIDCRGAICGLDGRCQARPDSGCMPNNGGVEACDSEDNDCNGQIDEIFDLGADTGHCGQCGFGCVFDNSLVSCQAAECHFDGCLPGYVDRDANPASGCEYACAPAGSEVCDKIDNDCNGLIDEGFNLNSDENNCGACGRVCNVPNAVPQCLGGLCGIENCEAGFRDANQDLSDGCEYACTAAGPEVCDGVDNNCDGRADEGCSCNPGESRPCGINQGRCKQGIEVCAGGLWSGVCEGMVEPIIELCNNIDDDCDGIVDNDVYEPCVSSCGDGLSICANGVITGCSAPPASPEVCDGRDNDCDGTADNGTRSCPAGMAAAGVCFCIDVYEASRSDATATSQGFANADARSAAGVMPWREVSYDGAAQACAAAGKRLCTFDEWRRACEGPGHFNFPYGDTNDPAICNGFMEGRPTKIAPTGSFPQCVSGYGAYDMSGNVFEWVNVDIGPRKGVVGGAYTRQGNDLRCDFAGTGEPASFTSGAIGFRCCVD